MANPWKWMLMPYTAVEARSLGLIGDSHTDRQWIASKGNAHIRSSNMSNKNNEFFNRQQQAHGEMQRSICHHKIVADFGSSLNDASINPFLVGESINESINLSVCVVYAACFGNVRGITSP